ncbi:TolC family protein [Methylocystis sp. L43]|jgi:cobalt-zinc-cadmium efflux system outer membrane protein|uniref:UVR domain-containing protein n=2 Tax=Methylocystaceae TaxID=31993 RepID=A0ABX6ENA2_9HYPH|nr:TolC family protein [Methylocystis sp. L43]MBG0804103.1 TolC family protein [Methylocystis sp. H15]QGM95822.1 hypothetical protein F7D13_17140 [Methylocystis rosea]
MGPRVPPTHTLAFTPGCQGRRETGAFPRSVQLTRAGAAQMQYDAIRIRLDGAIAEAWLGLEAVRKTIRIVEQRQVPQAYLSVETAASGFPAGTTDLAAVLDAECRLRAVKFELLKLKVEEQARYAELERLAGGSL